MKGMLALAPLAIVLFMALVVLVMDLFRPARVKGAAHLAWLTAAGCLLALGGVFLAWPGSSADLTFAWFPGGLRLDTFTLFGWGVLAAMTAVAVLLAQGFDVENELDHGEFHSFFLFALAGMMILVAATDLLLLLLGLETMSLAVYGLVACRRSSARSAEAGLKYFLNGAIASAFLVFALALLWGETGSLSYEVFGAAIAKGGNPLVLAATGLLLAAFGFKVAAVPFHLWTPDAYEGAPTPVSGFMASSVKTAAFLSLARLVFTALVPEGFKGLPFSFIDLIILISVLTMSVGNLAALHQKDVKRMLAYSSIAQAGYMLMALVLVPVLGSRLPGLSSLNGSLLFYLVAYGSASLLAFGVLSRLGAGGNEDATHTRLEGLANRSPFLALMLTLALLSLAGIPLTAGFFGKFYLFKEIIVQSKGRLIIFVIIAIVNSLISVAYYLRPIMSMYMKNTETPRREIRNSTATVALLLAALATLWFGIWPGWVELWSGKAAASITYRTGAGSDKDVGQLAPFADRAE